VFWVRRSDFLRPSDFGRAILDNGNSFEYRKRVSTGFAALGRAAVCTSCTCSMEFSPMKIAQIAPLYESVPPKYYGGTERVVSYLTEELVR